MDTIRSSKFARSWNKRIELRDEGRVPNQLLFIILFTGALITTLNQTAIKTALPTMINSLGVSTNTGQWAISGYTLVKGIMVPITAFAMTKFRTRNLFTLMMGVFGFGSLLAGLGFNFAFVLAGTILQGVAAGMIIPLMQTIILTLTDPENRGSALGIMAVVIGVGPMIGPAFGGWIVDILNWNSLFYLWAILSVLVMIGAQLYLYDVLPNSDPEIDWRTIIDSLIGFSLLLYGLTAVGSVGVGSWMVWLQIIIGLLFILNFFRRNLKASMPMLKVQLLKYKSFTLAVLIATLAFMILTATANIMPMYIQTISGLSATISGLVLLPGGFIKAVISPFIGKVYDRIGISFIGKIGGLLMFLGALMLVFVSVDTPLWYVVLGHSVISLGFGTFNIPITTLGMNALPNEDMSHGTSVRQTFRQVGASFAITISFVVMEITSNLFSNTTGQLTIDGIRGAFGAMAVLGFLTLVATFFLKDN